MDTPEKENVSETGRETVASEKQIAVPTTNVLPGGAQALPFYKNTNVLIALVVALALILGAGYYAYRTSTTGGTVAVVNGKKIYQKELDESVALIEQAATAQGIDSTDESAKKGIQDQALEVLINNALLITAALDMDITATDEAIQAKYDELAEQLGTEEELKKRMTEVGLTEEKLRSNIRERILADQYIEANTTIKELTVTEEEVLEFIKSINTGETELPPLDEIRPEIEAQILGQKQQAIVVELLAKLRGEADIEIKV